MPDMPDEFWTLSSAEALRYLGAGAGGLSSAEAASRLARYGPNRLQEQQRHSDLGLLVNQFRSPIILILLFAAVLSLYLGERTDAIIILVIVAVSGLLGFWQERGAGRAVADLLAIVEIKASVFRDGAARDLPTAQIVPGDVVALSAGVTIPGDGLVLDSRELFVDESTLTGETYPAEKASGVLAADTPMARRTNVLFMGTHVVSGSGRLLVVRTGTATEFGKVSQRLDTRHEETGFERGVRRFGYLLMEVTLLLVIAIFAVNVYLHRPVLDSFLFSMALAVGLTPQLLPAIISINLAHGARKMADAKVIVKKLAAIEDFGSMDVLCSDKTGTLTEGLVRLRSALGVDGADSEEVLRAATINSCLETGFSNPIDEAIRTTTKCDLDGWAKLDEEPYDFVRKRLSVLAGKDGARLMVTKGSLHDVLDVCSHARAPGGSEVAVSEVAERVRALYSELSAQGYRTLGVAIREDVVTDGITAKDETGMTFLGLIVLFDPPKDDAYETVAGLARLGVRLKIITGDNALVAATVGAQMGLAEPTVMTGGDLRHMDAAVLAARAGDVDIFAEIEPNQKERVIRALRKAGHIVGYMGDGINDASALHAADVGISVADAVDVAKEAADIVLLEKDLAVLSRGVAEGRTTFANTLKYVFMATSANFGNMFSMAGASLFLPFLPLLPTQILLTNLLTDFPEMTIATDSVDSELVARPRRWDIGFIRRFMMTFGLLSSVFDFLTFGALLLVLRAGPAEFRTGWLTESVLSASLVVLVIRTRRPFWRSRPGPLLATATAIIAVIVLALPYTPLGSLFRLVPLPLSFAVMLAAILAAYICAAEIAKRAFYRREEARRTS
jgi:Mg2+-importing ATPase